MDEMKQLMLEDVVLDLVFVCAFFCKESCIIWKLCSKWALLCMVLCSKCVPEKIVQYGLTLLYAREPK